MTIACHAQDAQAGRNVIDCLLRYMDKGGLWTDGSGLRVVAIDIMRKVCACRASYVASGVFDACAVTSCIHKPPFVYQFSPVGS